MTSDLVVDSCVVAKWVLIESDSAKANQLITDIVHQGAQLIVLDLVFPEVINAVWKRARRRLLTLDEARDCLDVLFASLVHTQAAAPVLRPGFEIAAKYGCAVYDALFVALARHLGLKGVTADEPLYNAVHADFPEIILLRNW